MPKTKKLAKKKAKTTKNKKKQFIARDREENNMVCVYPVVGTAVSCIQFQSYSAENMEAVLGPEI